jgi:serine-type D-Ala-D-Ala carboxypeptidase/endopeptidase (penicillin-binding protein 4)
MKRVLPVIFALLVLAPPARAADLAATQRLLAREMGKAGPAAGAYVVNVGTGQELYSYNADVERIPASVEKLYTSSTALLRLGPATTLTTKISGAGALDATGVWRGSLYLRGGGDPTLSNAGIGGLADLIVQDGIHRVAGSVVGDESFLDSLRGSYDTRFAYDPDIGGVLGGLTVGRGFSKDGSPANEAARRLASALRQRGIKVDGRSLAGPAPAGTQDLAVLLSPPIAELIRAMNVPSDNFYAETLIKDLGADFGGAGTTTAGAAVVRAQMAAFGISPRIVDGSGLSRVDHTTPRQVVQLLAAMRSQPVAGAFQASLPVAGRTGTISKRMRASAAQGRCQAKTGTLIGVSALAGYCEATGGHTIAFAFLMSGASVWRARSVQDHMAEAIARYDGP